jgi:hypothetical protein
VRSDYSTGDWPVKSSAHYFTWLACGIYSVFQRAAYFTGQLFDFEFQNVSISAFSF